MNNRPPTDREVVIEALRILEVLRQAVGKLAQRVSNIEKHLGYRAPDLSFEEIAKGYQREIEAAGNTEETC